MIALLLVAGYATRLYPLTINTPKPLLPVAGRPMLDYIADELDTLPDLTDICLISNHRFAEQFEQWAAARRLHSPDITITVLDDGTTDDTNKRGAIGDMQFAVDTLHIDDDIVIIAGDNLFTYRLKDMYDHFRKIRKDLLIAIHAFGKRNSYLSFQTARQNDDTVLFGHKIPPAACLICTVLPGAGRSYSFAVILWFPPCRRLQKLFQASA